MDVPRKHIFVGRIVNNADPDFVTIEVGRHDGVSFTVQDDDAFLTMVFVRQPAHSSKPGQMEAFIPW